MRILVTGGAGYIGSHTIALLAQQGHETVSIDNFSNSKPEVFDRLEKLTGKKIKNIEIDLCDHKKLLDTFKGEKFDAIIHFAAFKSVGDSVQNPLKYYENNIGGLIGALLLAKECQIRQFVFSSTCAVYDQSALPPYTEDSSVLPASPYGMTKSIGEKLLEGYAKHTPDFRAVSLRYFNPAGAHPSNIIGEESKGIPENLVPVIKNAAKTKMPFTIFGNNYQTPDGTCIRDYVHVVDIAEAHISALAYLAHTETSYAVFNLGTGKGTSIMEMVKAFEEASGMPVPFIIGEKRAGDMPVVYADTAKAMREFGWKPKFSLPDIMKTAWEWEKKRD